MQECTSLLDQTAPFILEELYLWEVLKGKPEIKFKGIYPLIEEFMADRMYPAEQVEQVRLYMNFLMARATGQVKTNARLIRDFIITHPEYKNDSIMSNQIAYDLVKSIDLYLEA